MGSIQHVNVLFVADALEAVLEVAAMADAIIFAKSAGRN